MRADGAVAIGVDFTDTQLQGASFEGADLRGRAMAQKLVTEHEMGELFKVIGLHKGPFWDAPGFREGDRTATL